MGKVKTIKMGDEKAEEQARAKAKALREEKKKTVEPEPIKKVVKKPTTSKYSFPTGKKYRQMITLVDKTKKYPVNEAIALVKQVSYSKFDGTVEAIFNVIEKGIRGTVALPHGTGKQVRVRVADDALVANPIIDFDILVAHPAMMPKLAKIAKILGPKGLMPNPKTNTISDHPEKLVEVLSKGQINFKTETDFPIIHTIIGKVSFDDKKLSENLASLIKAIGKDKIISLYLKPTMGPSVLTSL
jgi:large subunit ribosomal protein L1